ncbi:MAG TPA: nucleotidyltransferase domain-containing protein [Candidatus Hydrogenedentes bacterium]|nr:nucleotidyltransferase domain-containing protein [Candidatus Hydrogenedentota bacterium]
MDQEAILRRIKALLLGVHGDRLQGVVLYGSVARGEESDNSDIDVLVLLTGPVRFGPDLEKNIQALYPLSLELGHPISAKPVDEERYRSFVCPLFESAKREGIRV